MYITVKSLDEFQALKREPALLAYFSTEACSVCKVFKPKVEALLDSEFPAMKMAYVRADVLPDVAGQHSVFTAPTILVFFEGHEYIRKSRSIGIDELREAIERPYHLLFS